MFVYNTITEVWTAEIDKYVKLHPFRHVYTPSHPNFLNSVESEWGYTHFLFVLALFIDYG